MVRLRQFAPGVSSNRPWGRWTVTQRAEKGAPLDASPEKTYYVPFPRLSHLQMPDLPRPRMPQLPHLRVRALSVIVRRRLWGRHTGHTSAQTRVYSIPEKLYYVPLPQLARWPVRGLSTTVRRGFRARHTLRRVAAALASRRPDARAVGRWWASHKPEALAWMLAVTSAVVVGMLVARL
jgi:hypothetical protein